MFATPENQTTADIDDGLVPLSEPWERVRQQALAITMEEMHKNEKAGSVPVAMKRYIRALCDPEKTIIVVNGGAGTGKTLTAALVAMLMLAQGSATSLKHTKPLVSAGGASVGFERGSMDDKLLFWTKPVADAAKRVVGRCGIVADLFDAYVKAFPIHRIRGISRPAGEWMLADEMQNAYSPLFTCMMTRAEKGSKVVVCGSIEQSDLPIISKRPGGMAMIVRAWKRLEELVKGAAGEKDPLKQESAC